MGVALALFGPASVIIGAGRPAVFRTAKDQALLTYLVMEAERAHPRVMLAAMLWPESPESTARGNLRQSLSRLRDLLGSEHSRQDYLIGSPETIQFNRHSTHWLDVASFQSLRKAVLEHVHRSVTTCDSCRLLLAQALELYRGDFLGEFSLRDSTPFEEWVVTRREQLKIQAMWAVSELTAYFEAHGDYERMAHYARRALDMESMSDGAHFNLVRALAFGGQRDAALSHYQAYCELNEREGLPPPSGAFAEFHSRLRSGAALRPLDGESVAEPGEAPFMGLHYFDEQDADLFFGRERLVNKLVSQLRKAALDAESEAPRFYAIVGASGSGKTSLVRAGLIPAIKKAQPVSGVDAAQYDTEWIVRAMTPTAKPLGQLALAMGGSANTPGAWQLARDFAADPRALTDSAARLGVDGELGRRRVLLVIDQFEELFTLCPDEDERQAFVDNLVTAAAEPDGAFVLFMALRGDYYAHCARYPSLRDLLPGRHEMLGPMSNDDLRRAIEEPARQGNWALEDGLVELLLRDVGREPGSLPLLSHALLGTWQQREGRRLTLRGYVATGGVRQALTHTAEKTYASLNPARQAVARAVFVGLTQVGDNGRYTRRRATRAELLEGVEQAEWLDQVLTVLADARLITIAEYSVEVAHEALITEWERWSQWLEEDREDLQTRRSLGESAASWVKSNREPEALLRGRRLAKLREWADAHPDKLNALDREFLDVSVAAAQRESEEREARRRRELLAAQQLAETERQRAEEQTQAAKKLNERNVALSAASVLAVILMLVAVIVAGQARQIGDRNKVLADENINVAATAGAGRATAQAASTLAVAESRLSAAHEADANFARATAVAIADELEAQRLAVESNNLFLTGGRANLIALLSLRSVKTQHTSQGDSALVVAQSLDYPYHVFNSAANVLAAAFSPDGRAVVLGGVGGTIEVWDAQQGTLARSPAGHSKDVQSVAVSPDGRWILSGGADGTAILWELATGQQVRTFKGHAESVNGVAFSPDGAHIATASVDKTVIIWNTQTGEPERTISGHTDLLLSVAYSPDGLSILTAGADGTARLWDALTGRELVIFKGHADRVLKAAFSADGNTVITSSVDGAAILWDAHSGALLRKFTGHSGPVTGAAISPDGRYVLTAGYDNTARLWDAATGGELRRYVGHTRGINAVVFSPDGRSFVTVASDNTARLWLTLGAPPLPALNGHAASVNVAVLSSDGRYAFTGSSDHTARLWDAATGATLSVFTEHTDVVNGVGISPDGGWLATAGWGGNIRIWDAATRAELRSFVHPGGVLALAISPDGTQILTGGWNGNAMLWDAATGRQLALLTGHTDVVFSVAFSPDGKFALTGSFDKTARLWDLATQSVAATYSGHDEGVTGVAFSPDGQYVFAASTDKTIFQWRAATGELVRKFADSTDVVWAVAASPDGKYLASGGGDKLVRIYDLATGRLLRVLSGHTAAIESVAFSADGKVLITGSDDGTARQWYTDYNDIVRYLCSLPLGDLTADERAYYGVRDTGPTCP
ncbi:MAG: hypothetical protein HYY33_06415 [Chloroflexi bacterium]|nr:hypothetical protein [Chloroflexota bacterium]